jgi:hypothetical protein
MPQQQQPSPAAMQRQQRQQQQQQAPVSMADFPSLDEAATAQAAGDDTPLEKDYLVEALNKLKLGEFEKRTACSSAFGAGAALFTQARVSYKVS